MYNKNVRYDSDYYLIESNPMTIIIGADCGNTLIIASDSKATSVEDGTKIINEPKIFYEEPIRGYIRYIIAGAGKPCYIEGAAVNGRLGLFYVSRNGCARPIYTFAPIGTALGKSISRFLFKKIDKVEAFLGDNLDFNIA